MTKGSKKGSGFERDMCKQLSLWWTNGKRDDIFWRTAGSGARAKTRSKQKQSTFGQYGDVQATDPIGQPLMNLVTIELKRGYPKETFANIVEESRIANSKVCGFIQFVNQARADSKNAKTPYWLLISKRNMREAIITMPIKLYRDLKKVSCIKHCIPCSMTTQKNGAKYFTTTLDRFLQVVPPKNFWTGLAEMN